MIISKYTPLVNSLLKILIKFQNSNPHLFKKYCASKMIVNDVGISRSSFRGKSSGVDLAPNRLCC